MLEPATPLRVVDQIRRRDWRNGSAALGSNDLGRQRTVGDPLSGRALIGPVGPIRLRVRGKQVEMDVQQGLPKAFSPGKPSIFGLYKPNLGGGGGIRTCDQGLMSSWLSGLWVVGVVRSCPVFGGNTPEFRASGCRRPGAVRREQRKMDVEMDVRQGREGAAFTSLRAPSLRIYCPVDPVQWHCFDSWVFIRLPGTR